MKIVMAPYSFRIVGLVTESTNTFEYLNIKQPETFVVVRNKAFIV